MEERPFMSQQLERERYKLLNSIERLLEGPMVFLGFVWLLLLIVELIWGLPPTLEYLSLAIWIIFIIDFLIKIILAPQRVAFLKKNWLTAISLFIPALRVFRVFRAVRALQGLRGIRLVKIVSSLNRSMKSLSAAMGRRGFGYVMLLSAVITFAGAAGMYGLERNNQGFENYGMALWWTAMRVITAGSDFWPATPEGRILAFLLSLYGYAVFGYVTATLATFFIGVDAQQKEARVAGAKDVKALGQEIDRMSRLLKEMNERQHKANDQRS